MTSSLAAAQRELISALTNQVTAASTSTAEQQQQNAFTLLADRLLEFKSLANSEVELVNAAKLIREDVPFANIRLFLNNLRTVLEGKTAFIREDTITPVAELPRQKEIVGSVSTDNAGDLVKKTVFCKLNGGLGTSMGLDKAKSLLEVKNGKTFLDLIAQQTLYLREKFGKKGDDSSSNLRFCLMNSFSTSKDTFEFFNAKYADKFGGDIFNKEIEFKQSKVPKVRQTDLKPASCPISPDSEFTPPGHGEIFTSLASSGMLDRLIKEGFEYLFASNSDNLGATLDLSILSYFASKNLEFMMEVCERAPVDRKGGHLVRDAKDGRLILRESAQCHPDDEANYTDITKHKYFNTNNIWINLPALKKAIDENGGMLPLPPILNKKTVIPTDATSEKVYQLENAMGCAISYFKNTSAIVVDRDRFAPVKTCADLLTLRSDAYEETEDHRLVLRAELNGKPPVVSLEDKYYKFVNQLGELIKFGVPSMKDCTSLHIKGGVIFSPGSVLKGNVYIEQTRSDDSSLQFDGGVLTGTIKKE